MFSKRVRKSIAHCKNRSTYPIGFCQGYSVLVLFGIFISYLDNRIENTLKLLDNIKLESLLYFGSYALNGFASLEGKKKNLFNKHHVVNSGRKKTMWLAE